MWHRPTPRVGRTWTASRPGALRRGVLPTLRDHFPYVILVGIDLEQFKRGPLTLPLGNSSIKHFSSEGVE